jgi:acyl carrier protein
MTASDSDRSIPTPAEIAEAIQRHVRTVLLNGDFDGVDPLAEVEIDSLALEELLDHLEEAYFILFDPEDISRENLSSVERAAGMVHARIRAVASGKRLW